MSSALGFVAPDYLEHVFDKVVSETDAKHRFAYPVQHLHHLCDNPYELREAPIEFKIIDGDGNPYLLRLTLRREGYLKPELTGDWLRFVRDKGIKKHDRVVFMRHHHHHNPVGNEDGVVFTVTVRRAVMVFGAVFGYAYPPC